MRQLEIGRLIRDENSVLRELLTCFKQCGRTKAAERDVVLRHWRISLVLVYIDTNWPTIKFLFGAGSKMNSDVNPASHAHARHVRLHIVSP